MKINQAAEVIRTPLIEWSRPQSWCDLGCGTGTFTKALALLLSRRSTIHAVDFDQRALEGVPEEYNGVEIRKIAGDLQSTSLRLPRVDGVLIANVLHFIPEPRTFLRGLLSVTDRFLIVEYERSIPNRWGPYPIGFAKLREIFSEISVNRVEKLATRPSLFGGTLYSALAERCERG